MDAKSFDCTKNNKERKITINFFLFPGQSIVSCVGDKK